MSKNDQDLASHNEDAVRLEDLFELKRLEKPQADFWEGFDAQLQQKILNSAIDRRNFFQYSWEAVSAKLLPVSAFATAAAVVAFSMAPLFHKDAGYPSSSDPRPALYQPDALVSSVSLADEVDFHEVSLSATDGAGATAAQQFLVSGLSPDALGNQIYATNALAVSASPAAQVIGEQVF
jgi:hypothetical protein